MNEPKPQPRDIMSDTPRCDAEEYDATANTNSALLANDKQYVVLAEFARQLERELAQAQARCAELREALSHVLWVKDCGIDGTDERGVFRNWPEAERDQMYEIAKAALKEPR